MTNAAYAQEMLDDVISMALDIARFDFVLVLSLDLETFRACVAKGYHCTFVGNKDTSLRGQVEGSKFRVSKWFVDNGIDFVFFEMDVWFIKSVRSLKPKLDMLVATHQNNPRAINIGYFAIRANNATRNFFQDCVAEAKMKPHFSDQKIFEAVSNWHRICRTGEKEPSVWKYKPNTTCPKHSVYIDFIPPHTGVCSTHPIPTTETLFVHTLGNTPLQSPNGKRMHAKELGIWRGTRAYYAKSNKYLALDGFVNNGITLCQEEGYHQRFWLWTQLAVLITFAKASHRILILPKIIADFFVFFPWTFLDLESLHDLCDFRETNFVSHRRAWYNNTHPFSSVAQISLRDDAIGIALDQTVSWYALSPSFSVHEKWHHWAAAVNSLRERQLLLLHPGFITPGLAAKIFSVCSNSRKRECVDDIHPALFYVVEKLRFCDRGAYVDLAKHASNTFQDTDCFGLGSHRVQRSGDTTTTKK
eukprot:CAMPEP_0197307678 /NCGR_PEP_ID=MMETSP0891-20130614/5594_1 /TAXON_ID=44058 ORGANISM="Aureoumbra lagunensis, Strain CCMP1510" /NCGR_SAMPLE_ID=MMETSP0891 /ASSEMBLY_ACC=CAM_ASM_000534 /LENGTH=472 /DNA_ID=CAMNT_0042791305 /DNA_START=625 /DNA_END=2043 /DNA_ORIENTATION=-